MDKQEWLAIKASKQMPMELFYEFYKEHNKEEEMTPEEFRNKFQNHVYRVGHIPTEKIIEYYDQKFQVTKLIDRKTGNIIKEY